jgi:hypothetical protein
MGAPFMHVYELVRDGLAFIDQGGHRRGSRDFKALPAPVGFDAGEFSKVSARPSKCLTPIQHSAHFREGRRPRQQMSKRFYFDVENGQATIWDEEGVRADSLEQALLDARSVISEMAGDLGDGILGAEPMLLVRDAAGSLVARLPIEHSQHRVSSSDPGNGQGLIRRQG